MAMARKNTSLFAKFDLDYADHPKIAALSDGAFRAHVEMILYSRKYLTDGRIPKRFANRFGTDSVSELLSNSDDAPSLVESDDGDYWLHDYADHQETKAEVEARRLVNAENGKRGGRPANRTAKRTKTQSVTDSVSDSGSEMKAETETETEVTPIAPKGGDDDPQFDIFWDAYGIKRSKVVAQRRWKNALKKRGVTADIIIDAAVRYIDDQKARGKYPEYTKRPDAWLNQECWNDELEASSAATPDDGWYNPPEPPADLLADYEPEARRD